MDIRKAFLYECRRDHARTGMELKNGLRIFPVIRDIFPDPDDESKCRFCIDDSNILIDSDDISSFLSVRKTGYYKWLADRMGREDTDEMYPFNVHIGDDYIYDSQSSVDTIMEASFQNDEKALIRLKSGKHIVAAVDSVVDYTYEESNDIHIGLIIRDYEKDFVEILDVSDIKNLIVIFSLETIAMVSLLGLSWKDRERRNADIDRAIKCYELGAEYGSTDSMIELGKVYELGVPGLPSNRNKALEFYIMAAGDDDIRAYSCLGNLYRYRVKKGRLVESTNKTDQKRAFEYYAIGTLRGDVYSMCETGDYYARGDIVEKDTQHAFMLYHRAFTKIKNINDDLFAIVLLRIGLCYLYGWGCRKDLKLAGDTLRSALDTIKIMMESKRDSDLFLQMHYDRAEAGLELVSSGEEQEKAEQEAESNWSMKDNE